MAVRKLVLWDVDHTLIETRGVGRELFRDAFKGATGRDLEHAATVTGRTERIIFRETVEMHSIPYTPELFDRYADLLARGYRVRIAELARRGRALPGAVDTIAALADVGIIVQSVLTGNLRSVAETKLTTFGVNIGLDLDVGAYGCDDDVRAELVRVAQRRAYEKYGTRFEADTTVVIGDTPSDIAAAHEGGARVIAVASGKSTLEELAQAGADLVLAGLENTVVVMEAVVRLTRQDRA